MSNAIGGKWRVVTPYGVVTVFATSEAHAASRGKWKAVHVEFNFPNKAQEMIAVRECEVFEVRRVD